MTNNGYTKEITLENNFLDNCGYTVKEVRKYLSKFPDDAQICVSIEGDTHGCRLESIITHKIEMNDEEILQDKIKRVKDRISELKKSINYYIMYGKQDRLAQTGLIGNLADYEKQLSELLK